MPKPQPASLNHEDIVSLAKEVIKKAKFPMLATSEGSQPRVRPVSPVHVDQFTVYIANLRSYQKTTQIAINPKVELCYIDGDHNQVRITGIATIETDLALLNLFWKKNRLLEHYLGSINNPELIVYRITPNNIKYMQEWALEYTDVPIE